MSKNNCFKKIICLILAGTMLFSLCGCDLLFGTQGKTSNPAVYIYQPEISLTVGDTVQLSAASNDKSTVGWLSLDEKIATVTDDGLITGVAEGETTIMAITSTGASSSCTIKVEKAPQPDDDPNKKPDDEPSKEGTITLNPTLSVNAGATASLTATLTNITDSVTWSSSSNAIATVAATADSKTATVTGVTAGSATITASAGGKSATCIVTVKKVTPTGSDKDGYSLVWYDEFEGNSLDTTKWNYQTGVRDDYKGENGPWYWGNNELQYYTQDSVTVNGGNLIITATKQNMDNDRTYKSGRILTRDKASWTYGYFEARMKLPLENGAWPAFWMLPQPSGANGTQNEYGGWAASGELDIMEAKCRKQNQTLGTIHYGGAWPNNTHRGGTYILPNSTIGEWHKYAVEWTADYIKWYVDDYAFYTLTSDNYYSTASSSPSAPFDKPFYILFNLAVDSGSFDTEANATFNSARMEVDYVRVYKKN